MIPVLLERLVLSGAATSEVLTFGGGALSSWELPSNRVAIMWQLEIFPFADIADAALNPAAMAARMIHYYEFSDDRVRFGKLHRHAGQMLHPPPAPDTWNPAGPPAIYPVYQIFDSKKIICRIVWCPVNSRGQTTNAAPQQEGAVVAGYPVAVSAPVVESFQGWGAGGAAWVPDTRNTVAGQVVNQPRPVPTAAPPALNTLLNLPRTVVDEMQPYSWPIVCANVILVMKDEWEKITIQLRHELHGV